MNKIYNMDFLNNNLDESVIDIIITDPPHGVDLKNDIFDDSKNHVHDNLDSWIKEFARILKPNHHCYIYVPVKGLDIWISAVKKYLKYNNLIISANYTAPKYIYNNYTFDYQPIIFCSKGTAIGLNKIDWIESSIGWQKDKRNKNPQKYTHQYPAYLPKKYRADVKANKKIKLLHKCQKNELLIEKFILVSSQENEVVLDPFAGSGSTLKAAKKNGRKYIGYEMNKKVYDLIEV